MSRKLTRWGANKIGVIAATIKLVWLQPLFFGVLEEGGPFGFYRDADESWGATTSAHQCRGPGRGQQVPWTIARYSNAQHGDLDLQSKSNMRRRSEILPVQTCSEGIFWNNKGRRTGGLFYARLHHSLFLSVQISTSKWSERWLGFDFAWCVLRARLEATRVWLAGV